MQRRLQQQRDRREYASFAFYVKCQCSSGILRDPIVPLERRRKLVSRVLDVNDSAMGWGDRRGRSMQYQRPEREDGALLDETILLRFGAAKLVDLSR